LYQTVAELSTQAAVIRTLSGRSTWKRSSDPSQDNCPEGGGRVPRKEVRYDGQLRIEASKLRSKIETVLPRRISRQGGIEDLPKGLPGRGVEPHGRTLAGGA
jgi:hypothetical protein